MQISNENRTKKQQQLQHGIELKRNDRMNERREKWEKNGNIEFECEKVWSKLNALVECTLKNKKNCRNSLEVMHTIARRRMDRSTEANKCKRNCIRYFPYVLVTLAYWCWLASEFPRRRLRPFRISSLELPFIRTRTSQTQAQRSISPAEREQRLPLYATAPSISPPCPLSI